MDLALDKINEEVFIASDEIVRFDSRAVAFIRERALQNLRGRARICAHKKTTDSLHEMLIGIRSDSYIRPHRHEEKIESFHLVEGAADIVILTDDGDISDLIKLGPDKNFYYRLDLHRYHTLLINSPVLVIHEITNGPFDPTKCDFASFSPPEGDPAAIDYIEKLKLNVKSWENKYIG
ncbi:MAG: cupin fold metalloprotein, WbuC family [Nitrospina sp.]|jgi:cupin fold WbuC family metalloprotein|nr:cupin fold metalloprotein, WbuC family [Nitrospina sp.]